MESSRKTAIKAAEERLRAAMETSDVSELDALISSDLVFTTHLGQILSKQDDLEIHKSGMLKMEKLTLSEQNIIFKGDVAIVTTLAEITAQFQGQPANGKFRFTRVWANQEERWQAIVGHASAVT